MSDFCSLDDKTPTAHQRRPHNARNDAWMREFLHRQRFAHLGTWREQQTFVLTTTY